MEDDKSQNKFFPAGPSSFRPPPAFYAAALVLALLVNDRTELKTRPDFEKRIFVVASYSSCSFWLRRARG
jgi:hypothetical protein